MQVTGHLTSKRMLLLVSFIHYEQCGMVSRYSFTGLSYNWPPMPYESLKLESFPMLRSWLELQKHLPAVKKDSEIIRYIERPTSILLPLNLP